jgi:hypothetical protein
LDYAVSQKLPNTCSVVHIRHQAYHIPSTYAGQECILALAMALNRNIMVTVSGDLNNRVATYENSFTPDQAHPHIHIIWRRTGREN